MTSTWTLTARWIFPVERPPLEKGTVTIREDRILAVEPAGERTADVDLGDVAILPGLVNAHTHLDLTGLRGKGPPGDSFTDWLRAVIRHRRSRSPEQVLDDVRAGLAEALAHGTTLLGDISSQGFSWPVLAEAPVRAVVFYELLGLPRPRARQAWSDFRSWWQAHPATATCRPGVSPHAPYSVRSSLLRLAACFARRNHVPLAIHLAETREEGELLEQRRGPFVPFLEELGVWDPTGLADSIPEVIQLCGAAPTTLFVHGNYLQGGERFPPGSSVVYCPRTHSAFGHPVHPAVAGRFWSANNSVRIALGTDSLASNPDLDLLGEIRFLHKEFPEIPGAELLHMATLAGAEALGWQDETGSLAPGKSGDLVVLPLPAREEADPHRLILASDQPVQRVLARGRWVFERPGGPGRSA